MARLNVEDHAFGDPRLEKLARELRKRGYSADELSRHAALGLLASVWHESQAELKITASVEEIETWATLDGAGELLVAAKYARTTDTPGVFHIVGNDHQIAGLEAKKVKCRDAAKKRWAQKNQDEPPTPEECLLPDAEPMHDPCVTHAQPMRPDARPMRIDAQDQVQGQGQDRIQDQTSDKKVSFAPAAPLAVASPKHQTSAKRSKKKAPEDCTPGTRVFQAYQEEMQRHWNTHVERGDEDARHCKKLVSALGEAEAIRVVRYFVTRREKQWVAGGHALCDLVTYQRYRKIQRELAAGLKLTPEIVNDIVSKEQSENYIAAERMGVVNVDPFGLPVGTDEEVRRLEQAHP